MPAKYLSVPQAAKALDLSVQRISQFLHAGRVVGAQKIGGRWIIPAPVKIRGRK